MMRTLCFCILLTLFPSIASASSRSCEVRAQSAFPTFELTPGSDRRGPPIHDSTKPYSKVRGDYDGDGKTDIALLLRPKYGDGKYAISVCLSSRPGGAPEFIADAYTSGPLSTIPKGRKYQDFDTGAWHKYERDGVGSYCCECCGATYVFRKGEFEAVVDSD